jgi:hypothetical protein
VFKAVADRFLISAANLIGGLNANLWHATKLLRTSIEALQTNFNAQASERKRKARDKVSSNFGVGSDNREAGPAPTLHKENLNKALVFYHTKPFPLAIKSVGIALIFLCFMEKISWFFNELSGILSILPNPF